MKRAMDVILSALALIVLALPMVVVALAVRLDSRGPALYWSDRVGRGNRLFAMPKFRSMRQGAPVVATHLFADGSAHLTRLGPFLRKSSIDELPQLWCVLTGDMSIVGPRPALFNQHDLVEQRTAAGVDQLRPGLTGLAQVNGRDDLTIEDKVAYDRAYLENQGIWTDMKIIAATAWKVLGRAGIAH